MLLENDQEVFVGVGLPSVCHKFEGVLGVFGREGRIDGVVDGEAPTGVRTTADGE